ncbi:MAG: hypothetical protein WBY47_17570, partial [Desulfobacterales bacterium]
QNNNECASEKAKGGFANPFFNDRANPTGKGMPGVHYYPFKVSGSIIRTDEKGMAICFDEKYTISLMKCNITDIGSGLIGILGIRR